MCSIVPLLDSVYGKEKGGGLDDVSTALGFQQVALQEAQNLHHHMAGIVEDRSAKLENADKTEAITLLLNGTQALEASSGARACATAQPHEISIRHLRRLLSPASRSAVDRTADAVEVGLQGFARPALARSLSLHCPRTREFDPSRCC